MRHALENSFRGATATIRALLLVWVALGVWGSGLHAALAPELAVEYRIKAAYLYNFTKFVTWPPEVFPEDDSPVVIAVLGHDAAAIAAITDTLHGKSTADGRPIEVRADEVPGADLHSAHVVFVLREATSMLGLVREQLAGLPVLLVGESPGFAQSGGIINFVVSGEAVRFEINARRARAARLRVSGTLAAVARLVSDRGGP